MVSLWVRKVLLSPVQRCFRDRPATVSHARKDEGNKSRWNAAIQRGPQNIYFNPSLLNSQLRLPRSFLLLLCLFLLCPRH